MKKIALMLAVLMLASFVFVACADNRPDSEKIVESWTGELDFTDYFKGQFQLDKIDPIKVAITMTFKADNTYTVEADKEGMKKVMESLKPALREIVKGIAGEAIDEASLDQTIDSMFNSDEMTDNFKTEGKYKIEEGKLVDGKREDGKLYMTQDTTEQITAETEYMSYKFEDNKLVFTGSSDPEASSFGKVFPITFNKK